MKPVYIKAFLGAALCTALAFLCSFLAKDALRTPIFVVTLLGTAAMLLPAYVLPLKGIGRRALTVKVFAWVAFLAILVTCLVFSIQWFEVKNLILTVGLEAVIAGIIMYAVSR